MYGFALIFLDCFIPHNDVEANNDAPLQGTKQSVELVEILFKITC